MELIANNNPQQMIQDVNSITHTDNGNFIEANTIKVGLDHLKKDCIIPVFSKDNESTISHYSFVSKAIEVVEKQFPGVSVASPQIRVSHIVKGRIPSAIGKPAKELKENEKTIYYERCAFMVELPEIKHVVNGNELSLSVGGVRAYNQQNLYSKKSLEKFQIFIGFRNRVCTNLCVSTDGFSDAVRIASILELESQMVDLFSSYDRENHLGMMERMSRYSLTEEQFAHFIGKCRMYQYLNKVDQNLLPSFTLNDGQINNVVRDYYTCPNFNRSSDGSINLWNLYNLFTEANKSSYIDNNISRNVVAYELVNKLGISLDNKTENWFLN